MKNYEGYTIEEKLKLIPKEATIQVSVPGLEGPPEDIPVGLFCKEAFDLIDHLSSVVSACNMELDNTRKQIAAKQKENHDLRGNVMIEAKKVADGLKEALENRIKTLEAELSKFRKVL